MFRSFKDKLTHLFKDKDLGELPKALEMGITRTAHGGLFQSQETYVRDFLEHFKDHVSARANSVELRADPKKRLHANGFRRLKDTKPRLRRSTSLWKKPRSVQVAFLKKN